jgi:hypothetical protein
MSYFILLILLNCTGVAIAQNSEPMSNADVVKMVKANLPEKTIILAIQSAPPGFDTSADALIALSTAKVPNAIVDAMISRSNGGTNTGAAAGSQLTGLNPEEITLRDGDAQYTMKYLRPNMRSAARAFGLGGMANYAALSGTQAALRVVSTQPSFLVSIPENAQPQSYLAIVNLAIRKNGTREILVGGGGGFSTSYSSGFPSDRLIALSAEQNLDQSQAQAGFVLYTVTPKNSMAKGEYAIVLFNEQAQVTGFFLNPSPYGSYFDFGIDG